jgi:hypothetical protein
VVRRGSGFFVVATALCSPRQVRFVAMAFVVGALVSIVMVARVEELYELLHANSRRRTR